MRGMERRRGEEFVLCPRMKTEKSSPMGNSIPVILRLLEAAWCYV